MTIRIYQSIIFISHKPYTTVQRRHTYTITNTTWILTYIQDIKQRQGFETAQRITYLNMDSSEAGPINV
jgi:hypothetical protein